MATTEQKGLSSSRVCGLSSANIDLLGCSICHDLLWKPVACQSQILKKDYNSHEGDCALIELTCGDCKLVYRRGDAAEKYTEHICLREQIR